MTEEELIKKTKEQEKIQEDILSSKWFLAEQDRGLGRIDYGIIDERGELLVGNLRRWFAEYIVKAHNDRRDKKSDL